MKLKVCGMKYPQNIEDVSDSKPDFMGFIFYSGSKRFVEKHEVADVISSLDDEIRTVGVFVNQPIAEVISVYNDLNLDLAQLHGNESCNYIVELKQSEVKVIKVFHIDQDFNWSACKQYVKYSDYFLFDTATKNYGGSGEHFDWKLLKDYKEPMPFLLSGGIGSQDLPSIKKLQLPFLAGIDVNSQFEIAPGIKDTEKIQSFKNKLTDEYKV